MFVTLVFFCLQLITGLVRRDPTALSRAGLGLAQVDPRVVRRSSRSPGCCSRSPISSRSASCRRPATRWPASATGSRSSSPGLATINIATPGVGAIVTIFLAGLAISAAAIVWFSLLIRKALLLVAIVFGPIALAGSAWDATKGWFGKWAAFVVALILSKLVLVVIFLVAVAQVSAPIDADLASISDPIAGIVLMFIAAFAPVHHLQVPQLRRLRHVPRDVERAGGEVRAQPPGAGSDCADGAATRRRSSSPCSRRGRGLRRTGTGAVGSRDRRVGPAPAGSARRPRGAERRSRPAPRWSTVRRRRIEVRRRHGGEGCASRRPRVGGADRSHADSHTQSAARRLHEAPPQSPAPAHASLRTSPAADGSRPLEDGERQAMTSDRTRRRSSWHPFSSRD